MTAWAWPQDRLVVCELDRPGGACVRRLTDPMPYEEAIAECERRQKLSEAPRLIGVAWTSFEGSR